MWQGGGVRPLRASATASRARIARVAEALGPATPAAMASPTVFLVTGCSRGIGIEWAKQILARGDSLIATCRNPDSAAELNAVLAAHSGPGFAISLPLDVASEASIRALPEAIAATGKTSGVDVLVHNAGVSAPTHPVDPAETVSKAAMMDCFETNAVFSPPPLQPRPALIVRVEQVGPMLVTQACLKLLSPGKKIFFVSTAMASMERTDQASGGGSVSYRASKSGLNMVGRLIAAEWGLGTEADLAVTLCHPGWVDTDMGAAGNRSPPVQPPDSVSGMLTVIDQMGPQSTANFVDWEGVSY